MGMIRCKPEDFHVDEIPLVEPHGAGEQALLHIEKRGSNTGWAAGFLARCADVPLKDGWNRAFIRHKRHGV